MRIRDPHKYDLNEHRRQPTWNKTLSTGGSHANGPGPIAFAAFGV